MGDPQYRFRTAFSVSLSPHRNKYSYTCSFYRAIMTVFQIEGAGNDPITRYLAFWSLICALLSLLYGCLFIIRFGTIRKTYKAAEWALVGSAVHYFLGSALFLSRKQKTRKRLYGMAG